MLVFKQGVNYCATNYHLLDSVSSQDTLLVGVNLKAGKTHVNARIAASNREKDILILELREWAQIRSRAHFDTVDQAGFGISMFAQASDYRAGDGTVSIGFPLGIGTEIVGNQPVARSGIIAQTLRLDGSFLLDGMSSHGNSGSPVFNTSSGKLLGIVRGYRNDLVEVLDLQNNVIARIPNNSGISVCIGSNLIWDMLP